MNSFQYITVLFFFFASILSSTALIAQQHTDSLRYDTSAVYEDSKEARVAFKLKKYKDWSHPKKALMWALIIPGAGQVYNKKYWKLPILYAGVGAVTYFWVTNQLGYSEFKNAYNRNYDKLEADPNYDIFETDLTYGSAYVYTNLDQLATERNTYRRYRDMSIAGGIALYAISLVDAYVDAHLSTFDLKEDLSLTVSPTFYNFNATFVPGLSLSLNFKNNKISNSKLIRSDF